jgi:hypothetical protein
MPRIKKYAEGQKSNLNPVQTLSSFQTFLVDDTPNSTYFKITEFKDTFTGGKNGFLIEGSEYLKETTEIKIQILDVAGNPVYYEPGNGVPEYYEGTSKLIAVYIYEDTPIGEAKITILGELKSYVDDGGVVRDVPDEWKNVYNVKWEKPFKINRLLSNEDKVRFYKRPNVSITEIVKPIYSNILTNVTQKGIVDGFAQVPGTGVRLTDFSNPTSYLVQINDGGAWTGSVVGTTIEFADLGFSSVVSDVINNTDLYIQTPYTQNGLVSDFSNQGYTASFNYIEGLDNLKTALTGSFAKITLSDLTTFVGDVARVKIFRKSQSDLSDYQFIQEIQLESNEVLKDLETTTKNEEYYGGFDLFNYKNYWLTSSNNITTAFNQNYLYNSVKLNSSTTNLFFTSKSLDVNANTEYTLTFNARVGSPANTSDSLKVYLSGSRQSTFGNVTTDVATTQNIITLTSDNSLLQKSQINANFKADDLSNVKLVFEVKGTDWYISDVSMRASQETSFSPDEISFIQPIPRTLPRETFDFRFQFYDINNNYIPVVVEENKTFDGGNLNVINKDLQLVPSSLYFQFDSGSGNGNPIPPTVISVDVIKSYLTGSVTYTSRSFDFFGNELSSSQYISGSMPGLLLNRETDLVTLTVSNFTGSREDVIVQYIQYTGECEGITDSFVITRVMDGKGGVNYEIRPYRGTVIRNNDPSGSLEIQAVRIDGINELDIRSGLPFGRSSNKLYVASGSYYVTLTDASASGFVKGIYPGVTGSGELDYNAIFDRDSIDGQRTIYLIASGSEPTLSSPNLTASIYTTLTLTDLLDGIDAGFVTYDADAFTINPRLSKVFTPPSASATASFYRRGTSSNPISASVMVYPSMSINADFVPEYWVYYMTQSINSDIKISATDDNNFIIASTLENQFVGTPLSQSKTLTINWTYIEPYSSESVSINKTFTIVPEGKPGDESIVFEIVPANVNLNANSRGIITDYSPSTTEIKLKQGSRYLAFTGSKKPGTFDLDYNKIVSASVTGGKVEFFQTSSMFVSQSFGLVHLSGSITYPLFIHPYYTSSQYTQSIVQQYTKVLDGPPPIQIVISPTSVAIPADEVGYISSYASTNTTLTVKEGDDFLTFTTRSTAPGTWRINSIETRNSGVWNIRTGSLSSSSLSTATINYNRFDAPYVSASALYTIQVYPFALGSGHQYTSSIFTRTQTFTKNVAPPNARSLDFRASTLTIPYDRDGYTDVGDVTLTVTAFNTTASYIPPLSPSTPRLQRQQGPNAYLYYVESDGSEIFYEGPVVLQGTPPTADFSSLGGGDAAGPGENKTWKVKLTDGDAPDASIVPLPPSIIKAEAQLTIAGIKGGADAYKYSATNTNASITADLWTTQFTGSGMQISAFKGTTQLSHTSSYVVLQEVNDYLGNLIGNLGFYSASIFTTSSWINVAPPNRLIGNPAAINDIVSWYAPAVNHSAQIIYKIDYEKNRQIDFVTQSLAVQFTPPAPYSANLSSENAGIMYRVSGELEFDLSTTLIRVYRGDLELTNVSSFSGGQLDAYGNIGYPNQSRVSILSYSGHITLAGGLTAGSHVSGVPAEFTGISGWSSPETIASGEIIFQIDCEGRETLYKTLSLSVVYEGNTGPGIVMRGVWTSTLDYIAETANQRRDAVIWPDPATINKETHYWAAITGSGPGTPVGPQQPDGVVPYDDTNYWQYLGQEEFFVAAQIAIFQESYVKNTINVGTKDGTGAFANIVIAGGRPDPYIALGQTGTQGTAGTSGTSAPPAGVIGYNRPGIFLGVYEDGSNGTTGRFSIKTTGTSGKGMFWDGDQLTIVGSIRQKEPGVPEGSFRGVWQDGIIYYPDDSVRYGPSSYINSVTHTSTDDTDIDTGYPPNATNSWVVLAAAGTSGLSGTSGVSGTSGAPGAGVVFRGNFTTSSVYYYTTQRRDIVRTGSSFWLANNVLRNNQSGSLWGTPAPSNTNWTTFGAQFTSVATDVLLAQDATITRGLVMGTEGSDSGFIRSANAQTLLSGEGFYLDVNGKMRFGQQVSGSNKYVYFDGEDLNINATVNAPDGNIGGFIIANNKLSASGSLLVLDTQIPQIEIYQRGDNAAARVVFNSSDNLTDPSSGTTYVSASTWTGTIAAASSGTTAGVDTYVQQYNRGGLGVTTNGSGNPQPLVTLTAGATQFQVAIPQTSLTQTAGTISTSTDYPPEPPTEFYQSYASRFATPRTAEGRWYLQLWNSAGTVKVAEAEVVGAHQYRSGAYSYSYYYTGGTLPLFWSGPISYTAPASYTGDIPNGNYGGTIIIPASGTYRVALAYKINVGSGAVRDYVNDTATYYANTATPSHSQTGFIDFLYFSFTPNKNKTEITNGGFQVINNANAYFRVRRFEPSSYGFSSYILQSKGGIHDFTAGGTTTSQIYNNQALAVYGEIYSIGTLDIGSGSPTVTKTEILKVSGGTTKTAVFDVHVLPYVNNTYSLGNTSYKWTQVWATTGTIQTSDITQKTNVEKSSLGLDFINRLNPVSYKFISGSAIFEESEIITITKTIKEEVRSEDGTIIEPAEYKEVPNPDFRKLVGWNPGTRKHYGLIAQEVKTVLDDLNVTTNDFAGYIEGDLKKHTDLGLRYEEFIAPMIKAIQELSEKVNRLEAHISGSL